MFDGLDEYKLLDTTTFELELPTGGSARAPTGKNDEKGEQIFEIMTITVRRMSSGAVQQFLNKRKNTQIKVLKRHKNISAESIDSDALDMLTFCVVGWSGFYSGGKPVECNRLNVHNLLNDDTFVWIRQQIDRAVLDDSGFLGNS